MPDYGHVRRPSTYFGSGQRLAGRDLHFDLIERSDPVDRAF